MNRMLLELLVCPLTGAELELQTAAEGGRQELRGPSGNVYPVVDGIPRFVADESFAESFGDQWNRFDVYQEGEDEATFEAKTGVHLAQLAGLRVLDAGCGGGRYARVAAAHGARVIGIDRSLAVEKARRLTAGMDNVVFVQGDLTALPFKRAAFDLVLCLGVLHHSPDPEAAFGAIAAAVKPGGRLCVWVYRQNLWIQERINDVMRAMARKLPRRVLLQCCRLLALLGGVPLLNRTLNKLVNFSNHPVWENRVCDTFDWYSPRYQHHHTLGQVQGWFAHHGFVGIKELPPPKGGRFYRAAWELGMIIGSGVNVTGVRK